MTMKENKTEEQIGSHVDKGTLQEFKKEVLNKHGQLRGAYKEELGEAIKDRTEKLKKEVGDDKCREQNIVH